MQNKIICFMNFIEKIIYKNFEKVFPKLIIEKTPEFETIQKVLLLRQDRLGDVLISIPFLKALTKAKPNLELHILLGPKNIQLAPLMEKYCTKIWFYDKKLTETISLISKLRKEKFDLVIDLFDNASRTSSIFLNSLNVKYKLGFDKENSKVYSHIVPIPDKSQIHIVERLYSLLLPFGINPNDIDERLEIDESLLNSGIYPKNPSKKRLGIIISGSSEAKSWGNENIIEFSNKFSAEYPDWEIVIFATNKTLENQKEICSQSPAQGVPLVKSFLDFASQIKTCDFIITPDTSVVHLCSAFRIPSIVLYYSPEIPPKLKLWTPYKTEHLALMNEISVRNINISEVIDGIKKMMTDKAI